MPDTEATTWRFTFKDDFGSEVVETASGATPAEALMGIGFKAGNRAADGSVRSLVSYVVVAE